MDLKLPKLGEGADSGTVVTVFVNVGDKIAVDQPVIELENEKAVATIPATAAGTVTQVFVNPGDKIGVGQRILSFSEGGAGAPAKAPAPAVSQPVRVSDEPIQTPSPALQPEAVPTVEQTEGERSVAGTAAAPSIRKLARELGIDLTRVRGSARGGRIVLEDVRNYIQNLQRLATQSRTAPGPAGAPAASRPFEQVDFAKWGPVERKALSPLRQVIARRMLENWNAVPHVTQFDEADITALNALRKQYAPAYEAKGSRLTLTGLALKAVVEALRKHPIFNSSLDEFSQEIVFKNYYHIGIAVDTEAGLIVPVIRDVDRKSVLELSRELEELARKARERKVTSDDLKGGTFTISNQGGIGGAHFTPIVNKPEVAILGLGRGVMKAVVLENGVQPRWRRASRCTSSRGNGGTLTTETRKHGVFVNSSRCLCVSPGTPFGPKRPNSRDGAWFNH